MWGYYWGMSAAQVELCVADAPVTDYGSGRKRGKGEASPYRPEATDIQDKARRWEEKYEKGEKVTIDLEGFKLK